MGAGLGVRLVRPLLVVLFGLIVIVSSPVAAQTGGGQSPGTVGGCVSSPAACLGAPVSLPVGGSAGSTTPDDGCRTGRIVTPDAGGQSDRLPYCPDVDGDGVADEPAPPPPPPSHGEVVAAVCPSPSSPVIGASPDSFGVTGIETWLWDADDPQSTTISGSIRGYAVTCTTAPTAWTFDTGDPHAARWGHARTYTTDRAGSDDAGTDVRHMWEVDGTYTLTLDVRWSRTTTLDGAPLGADQTTTSATRTYQVHEVRPVPTTAPD